MSVANELLNTGHVQHAFIGIQPAPLTPELARDLGLEETSGVLVYAVGRGGPADRAHIVPGDILVAIAGTRLSSVEDLFTVLRKKHPGQTVAIELIHDGKRETVDVHLSSKPQ